MALTDFTTHTVRTAAAPTGPRSSIATVLAVWRSRRALARLDDAALSDIGISYKRASQEAVKPIWDVPATWLK